MLRAAFSRLGTWGDMAMSDLVQRNEKRLALMRPSITARERALGADLVAAHTSASVIEVERLGRMPAGTLVEGLARTPANLGLLARIEAHNAELVGLRMPVFGSGEAAVYGDYLALAIASMRSELRELKAVSAARGLSKM